MSELEYKPNFASASGPVGGATGYYGSAGSFEPKKTPNLLASMEGVGKALQGMQNNAFEEGKLDKLAGELDNDRFLFKSAYLAGAEYATAYTDLAEFQATLAEERAKSVAKGESAQQFYNNVVAKTIAEFTAKHKNIREINPEAASRLNQSLLNLATSSITEHTVSRIEKQRNNLVSGDTMSVIGSLSTALQLRGASPEEMYSTMSSELKSTFKVLDTNAMTLGVDAKGYKSGVLHTALDTVTQNLNMNVPEHRGFANLLQRQIRESISNGTLDIEGGTKLLSTIGAKIKEGANVAVQELKLDRALLAQQGGYSAEMYEGDLKQLAVAREQGVAPGTILETLTYLQKLAGTSAKGGSNARVYSKQDQQSQAREVAGIISNSDPVVVAQQTVSKTDTLKNKYVSEHSMTPVVSVATEYLDSPNPEEATEANAKSLLSIGYWFENINPMVDKKSVLGDDVYTFFTSRKNRALVADLADPQKRPQAMRKLHDNWTATKTAIKSNKELLFTPTGVEEYTNKYFSYPWESAIVSKFGSGANALFSSSMNRYVMYNTANGRVFGDKDAVVDSFNDSCMYESSDGATIVSSIPIVDIYPDLQVGGVDHNTVIIDSLKDVIRVAKNGKDVNYDKTFFAYDDVTATWSAHTIDDSGSTSITTISDLELSKRFAHNAAKSRINEQANASKAVVSVVYKKDTEDKAEPLTNKIVTLPTGKSVMVINNSTSNLATVAQKINQYLDASAIPEADKAPVREEVSKMIALGADYKDDSKLRIEFEKATGTDYNAFMYNALKPTDSDIKAVGDVGAVVSDLYSDTEEYDLTEEDRDYRLFYESLEANGITNVQIPQNFSLKTITIDEANKFFEYISDNVSTMSNPWGEINVLMDKEYATKTLDTLLSYGRMAIDKFDKEIYQRTRHSLEEWYNKFTSEPEAMRIAPGVVNLNVPPVQKTKGIKVKDTSNMSYDEWKKDLDSVKGEFTITGTWNNTAFGALGTEFAKTLYDHEGMLLDWRNTRPPKDQSNTKLKQVHVIGLGFVKGIHGREWDDKFEAARGDAEAISQVTADFGVWYFSNMERKLKAVGFDIEELRTNPTYKKTLFALGSFLWHGGRYNNTYYDCMKLARTDIKAARNKLMASSAYKQSGASRRRDYVAGLDYIALYH